MGVRWKFLHEGQSINSTKGEMFDRTTGISIESTKENEKMEEMEKTLMFSDSAADIMAYLASVDDKREHQNLFDEVTAPNAASGSSEPTDKHELHMLLEAPSSDVPEPVSFDPQPEKISAPIPDSSEVAFEDDEMVSMGNRSAAASKPFRLGGPEQSGRSPSPVIIWRPTMRIKLATDIPPELLPDYNGQMFEEEENFPLDDSMHPPSLFPASKHYSRHYEEVSSSFIYKPKTPKKPARYGAWYLPVDQWQKTLTENPRTEESIEQEAEKYTKRISMYGHDQDPYKGAEDGQGDSLDAKTVEILNQIRKLPISMKYKEYILKEGRGRVPHYLGRVETPESESQVNGK